MYKLYKDIANVKEVGVILTHENGSQTSIPFAEGNRDYQKYLEWLAEGNTPEPADE